MSTKYETTPIDFAEALTILFIAFKVAGIIDLSWWFVIVPVLTRAIILWIIEITE